MENDEQFMRRALQLATLGGVFVAPNPLVGCVIVYENRIIGEGYHQQHGQAHAEINAINSVKDNALLKYATIYVTLEPCSHFGKTPPCADAIVRHQFKRVVIACRDTFSKVAGKGIKRIQEAGIAVQLGVCEKEARFLNRRFFTFHEQKRPYVILKWAQTQDGFLDRLPENRNTGINWITEPLTKSLVHKWRGEEQCILVGVQTIINDDPSLNLRNYHLGKNPIRIILDLEGKIPQGAKVLTDGGTTIVFTHSKNLHIDAPYVKVIHLAIFSVGAILHQLYEMDFLSVFVEGGAYTLNQFIEAGLWDEARVLTGKISFGNGLKAPQINLSGQESFFGNDKITTYYNT